VTRSQVDRRHRRDGTGAVFALEAEAVRDVAQVKALHMEHVLDRRRVRCVGACEPAHDIRRFHKLGAQRT